MRGMCGAHLSLADEIPILIRRLRREELAQAFPLLREAGRCETVQAWIEYASGFTNENPEPSWPAGIMAAEQASRCIVGLYSYVVRPSLRHGRVLSVAELTVMTPFGRDVVAGRLLGSVAGLARSQGVAESEICLANAAAWWAPLLGARGFALDDRRQLVWRRTSQVESVGASTTLSVTARS
jgi:hypothetical protein